MFSKNLMWSFLDKESTGTWSVSQVIWNIVLVVCVAVATWTVGTAFGATATAAVLDCFNNYIIFGP